MTEQEKNFLIRNLCARLPYGLWYQSYHSEGGVEGKGTFKYYVGLDTEDAARSVSYILPNCKPYLRPMSSMTYEELDEIKLLKSQLVDCDENNDEKFCEILGKINNFYYSRHIDCNNLINRGMAIAVTEENNPYK